MIELQEASTMLFFGPTSSGKTFLMRSLMRPYRRVLWFDTTYEIDDSDREFEHIYNLPTLVSRLTEGSSVHKIAYHPITADVEKEMDLVSRFYWHEEFSRWFVLDEVHEFNNSQTLKPQMKYGRKRLLGILAASQRICDVKPHVRTNARAVVLFYTNEARDIDAIAASYGDNTAEAVTNLRPLIYNDATKVVTQKPQCVLYKRGQGFTVIEL